MLARKPESEFQKKIAQLGFPELVGELVRILGERRATHLAGVSEFRILRRWQDGEHCKNEGELEDRFVLALRLLLQIEEQFDARTARQWFGGSSPSLNDTAPALLLVESSSADTERTLFQAMRDFLA
jgi:hypothetical protein